MAGNKSVFFSFGFCGIEMVKKCVCFFCLWSFVYSTVFGVVESMLCFLGFDVLKRRSCFSFDESYPGPKTIWRLGCAKLTEAAILKDINPRCFSKGARIGDTCIFSSFDRTSMILRHKHSRRQTLKIFHCFSHHEEAL